MKPTSIRHYFGALVLACLIVAGIVQSSVIGRNAVGGEHLALAMHSDRTADRIADNATSRGATRSQAGEALQVEGAVPSTTSTSSTTLVAAPVPSTPVQGILATHYFQPFPDKGCAHSTLALGTTITVTNSATGKSVKCMVNDRLLSDSSTALSLDDSLFAQVADLSLGSFDAHIANS